MIKKVIIGWAREQMNEQKNIEAEKQKQKSEKRKIRKFLNGWKKN